MTTHTTFFQRFIESLGIHKIQTYTEDVGKEQTRTLNEFSVVGEELRSLYREITGKQYPTKYKVHISRDVFRTFSAVRRPLHRLEKLAKKAATVEDEKKRSELRIQARRDYKKISSAMQKVYRHLLDFDHPNTNLTGYNALFDMWRSIEKRLNASEIKSVCGSNHSSELFEREHDVLDDELKTYNIDKRELLELDRAFLTMIIRLRKHFSSLIQRYHDMVSSSIPKETARKFVVDLHYVQHVVDRLRFQEERVFAKDKEHMDTFEKRNRQVAMYFIQSLERDVKELRKKLSSLVNAHIQTTVEQKT